GATLRDRATRGMGPPPEHGADLYAIPPGHGSSHRDPAGRLAAISATAGTTLLVFGCGNSCPPGRRAPYALPLCARAVAPVGLRLSVRASECLGTASRRSPQPRAARCRSPGRGVDHSRREVWQDSAGARASLHVPGPRRLPPPTAASLEGPASVLVCVRLELGKSPGWRRHSSYLLCVVPADRPARPRRPS